MPTVHRIATNRPGTLLLFWKPLFSMRGVSFQGCKNSTIKTLVIYVESTLRRGFEVGCLFFLSHKETMSQM